MARSRLDLRDNFGRFQKYATVNLTKHLQKIADTTNKNLREDVAKKLEQTFKNNLEQSYRASGNSSDFSYTHTGKLLESIHSIVEEDKVRIVMDELSYPNGRTTSQVYEYLTYGVELTSGTTKPYHFKGSDGHWKTAESHSTPVHLFEDHTRTQMISYLETIKTDVKNKKYSKKR